MEFEIIDRTTWNREEYFEHYAAKVPCTYSMTVKLDITSIKEKKQKLYPTMLYHLATVVNRHQEFRMARNAAGQLGIYREMSPSYTIFHKESETFSELWTAYTADYDRFCAAYEDDMRRYGGRQGFLAKPDMPPNVFPVSMIPWSTFEAFHLNLQKGYDYLRRSLQWANMSI